MPDGRAHLVLDAVVAEAGGLTSAATHTILARPSRRGGGRSLDLDAAVECIADTGAHSVVLARPPWVDPDTAALAGIAVLLGWEVVWLPAGLAEAGWAAALIAHWAAQADADDLVRRAQVAVGLAALPACRVPRRPWGCDAADVPALGADSLSRWCARVWEPCAHCRAGGGAPGAPCARCRHEGVPA